MLTEKSRLVIPLVFWGSKAPRSRILQISSVQNGKVIVTGSVDGIVMQWLVDESLGWMQPQMMLLAHDTAICCISPISTAVSTSKFITCSEDGHVCLWDSADGRIIDSLRTNYVHRKMKPYTKKGLQEVIFCVGDYSDVVALHPHDLNVLYTLNSRSEPDWITSFTLVQPAEKHDVLIGVSVSGVAKLWSLHDSNLKENGVNELFEDESKFISSRNVSTVAFSEKNVRMMLVICGNSWQIIDPSDLSQLILSECAIEALEGVIVDIDKVAIGFADSTIVLFQLPRSKLRGRQIRERFGNKPANVANIEQPFVFALLKGLATNPEKPLLNPAKFYFDSKLNPDNKTHRRIAYRVDEQSTISFWHVPKNLELLVSEFVRTKRPIVYEPTIRQNLADAWSRLNSVPPSIAEIEDGLAVTATVYVPTQGKLFLGREDGSIVMTNACHAIMVALLEGFGNEKAPYRMLKDGHVGPINCFLYPFGENVRYDPNVLLSGGADFSVVVWNITLGELTHRFCCQGGPVTRILVPPANCSSRVLNCICSIASDNSACLLSLKELKCILLASRQQFPIIDVRWRPLDDLLLLRCEDDSVYVWQIETGNLDRIITGLVAGEIMEACNEQFGLSYEGTEDEAGASQAVQMLRALKHKNVASLRKIAGQMDGRNVDTFHYSADTNLTPALDIIHLNNCSDTTHLVLFNVDALISGLLSLDYEVHQHSAAGSELNQMRDGRVGLNDLKIHNGTLQSHRDNSPSAFSLEATQNIQTANNRTTSTPTNLSGLLQQHSLYMDTAKLLITLIYAWNMDDNVDGICTDSLKLSRPRIPLCFGTMSKGHISLYTPYSSGKIPALDDFSFKYYSRNMHWQLNRVLTTIHLLAVVSLSNTLMALRNRAYELSSRKTPLRRALSTKSASEQMNEAESQQIKQGWSSVAALHCVLLPDFVRPRHSYASPRIDMLARKWQDSCIEIRDAAQALLIRELNRLGGEGRQQMIENWANFLPTQLDPSISIFGAAQLSTTNNTASATQNHVSTQQNNHANNDGTSTGSSSNQKEMMSSPSLLTSGGANSTTATDSFPKTPPPRPSVPPIPPRSSNSGSSLPTILTIRDDESNSINSTSRQNLRISPITTVVGSSFSSLDDQESIQTQLSGQIYCGGVHQIRRNQATAVIVLGVMGTEFASELQGHMDICRSTAHSLLELLLAPESPMVPVPHNSLLRRAAIDLLGRGFVIWQPHLDLSKVLIGLLNLAADCERYMQMNSPQFGAQLSPEADACRTARHALTLIASSRPQALITALNMEVVRYNAVVQHQTIQNPINSSLMKSRNEVLRLLEHLSEKQYNFVVDLIVPIGEILVHCLDLSLLKQRSLAELFPPIARFYMVAYCPTTRRLAFGGKNGVIVIHELRASKAQSVKAHGVPITALAFSQDGKYLAAYAAQEAKISFWQAQQTFLGMGQSQIRCAKTLPAPGEFPVISPGGSYQLFRARLVWINSKSLTLMLPNGKENRFSI